VIVYLGVRSHETFEEVEEVLVDDSRIRPEHKMSTYINLKYSPKRNIETPTPYGLDMEKLLLEQRRINFDFS
jgi:precorrin-6x reductase